jgi:hypothetical protein
MWKKLLNAVKSVITSRSVPASTRTPFHVYRVATPEGDRDLVSLCSDGFEFGLIEESMVGEVVPLLEEGDRITEANFRPNPAFVRLLHNVIARYAPQLPGLRAEARWQRTGHVYLIDGRTPTPDGHVPPCDIIGSFEVRSGEVVPRSYRPNANHKLWTADGLFQLEPALHERLMEPINEQIVATSHKVTG